MAAAGRGLLALGALVLLFLAYQLWGAGIAESRSQDALRHQMAGRLQAGHPASAPEAPTTAGAPSSTAAARPHPPTSPPSDGSPEGLVSIPAIGVDQVFVEGTGTGDLRRGPGHYPGTPLPGQPGNAAIAGHRTTYGAPFDKLDKLRRGDTIMITALWGSSQYEVRNSFVVNPSDLSVIAPTPSNQLTLTTCTPRFSASRRLIVQASLVGSPAPAGLTSQRAQPASSSSPSASTGAWLTLGTWALAVAAVIGVASLLAGRMRRRWPVYVLLAPALLATLAMFFAAASAMLPDMV